MHANPIERCVICENRPDRVGVAVEIDDDGTVSREVFIKSCRREFVVDGANGAIRQGVDADVAKPKLRLFSLGEANSCVRLRYPAREFGRFENGKSLYDGCPGRYIN